MRIEPALTARRLSDAFTSGRKAVKAHPADLLVFGEMGIGNTTSAAALSAALLLDVEQRTPEAIASFVGAGSGVTGTALADKAAVVVDAVERVGSQTDLVDLLAELGGTELAAICGAIFEARLQATPVILDGYIATAPALVLHSVAADFLAHAQAGHLSPEPGHAKQLERLGLEPLLDLGLRLGEGSGAAAAIPLVSMACRLVTEVPTFDEWFGVEAAT